MTRDVDANRWDAFLEGTPMGQFQQTAMWGKAKSLEGWAPLRWTLSRGGEIQGGFQVLVRPSRFGRIGYVTKGPVAGAGLASLEPHLLECLIQAVHSEGLAALVVQAPDESTLTSNDFRRLNFLPNRLTNVITATLWIDLNGTLQEIRGRMRRTTMLELNRAQKRGLTIREGGRNDLGGFFRLMVATCQRQQTSPSPSSESAFHALWDAFEDRCRLNLAQFEGEPLAGSFSIGFRDRLTFWKKGWSGAHPDKHPNQLVMYEAVEWAHQQGYKVFDCAGMSRSTAETILAGAHLTEEQKRSRDFFLLGYGGRPVLLPDSWVYFRKRLVRNFYQAAVSLPFLSPLLRKFRPA